MRRFLYHLWCRLHRYRVVYISDHPFLKDSNNIICWGDPGWHKIHKRLINLPAYGLCSNIPRFVKASKIQKELTKSNWHYGNPLDYPEKRWGW